MDIVERIILLLQESGKEQKDLADYLNVKLSTISDWKSGRTKSYKKYMNEIAQFFGITVDYLINGFEPLIIEKNLQKNVNGNNNITIASSEDEQILALLKQMDIVQRSKAIIAINEILKEKDT